MDTSKVAAKAAGPVIVQENVIKGTLFSLGAIVAGIVLWVILWRMGFIASIVAFAIAWLAVKLYRLGAGILTRKSAYIIMAVSLLGVFLAFLAGMASDLADFIVDESKMSLSEVVTNGNFWDMFFENITRNGELWKEYRTDLLISLVFAGLGMFWTLKELFIAPGKPAKAAK